MAEWKTMDSAPEGVPFLAIKWWRDYANGGGEWKHMGAFNRRPPPPHDKSVFAVSADQAYWLRAHTWGDGTKELDAWRWMEIPPLPAPLGN